MQKYLNSRSLFKLINLPVLFLIILNLAIFNKYWLGISTPPWDFLGGGMVEQFRFYKDGGFFNPPSWFPYAWFGIPEYQMLQDGGWFIPVAFVAELFGWHPANAARVQAFLILFGSVGTYYLSGRFISKQWINLLTGALYAFIPAFYSNAQHYGVVRSAAFLPWLLYFFHPKTIQNSKLSVLLGSIVIFQSIVGSYPGNLIASFYTVLLFIVFFGFQKNSAKKKYIQHISVMTISGVLMGLIRYLPTLKVKQSFPSDVGNQAGINLYNLNYLIYPYVGDSLPWQDLTLRSLYIGSVVLPLVFFFQRKTLFAFRWILIGTFSVFMMTFNSLNSVIREFLPLADVSRFAITDWRNTFNLSIIILSGLILNKLIDKDIELKFLRFILFLGFLGYLIFAGYGIGHTDFSLIIYSFFSILAFIIILYHRLFSEYFRFLIVIMACIFGILFVYQNKFSWMTTVKEQNFNIYNNTFTNVFESVKYPLKSRPERIAFLKPPLTEENYRNDQRYNRFWLTGGFGAYGYHNIKDINAYSSLFPRLEKETDPVVNFLLAKSKQAITIDERNIENLLTECTNSISCSSNFGIQVSQIVFDKSKEEFKVKAEQKFIMIQNEIYSPIWTGEICIENQCKKVISKPTLDSLRSWNLPEGEYSFKTKAETPLNKERWLLFYIGVLIAILSVKLTKAKN